MKANEHFNPPIRGSIAVSKEEIHENLNRGINPPIRGSIEQDNALFRDYNYNRQTYQMQWRINVI